MRILKVEWRSALDTVGIVLIENDMGQQSAKIGVANHIMMLSIDEEADALYIAENGAKLTFNEARGFFPDLDEKKYKK